MHAEQHERPDPDDLLAKIEADEPSVATGRLKIFFGYCAGVGKTFAMLHDAHELLARGREVVVGWVEPHERCETQALLEGLERIPPRRVEYRGTQLEEFDLDLALLGRPSLVIVDELAHTNAPGSRHAKRWQDVEELLKAGIDVHTSLNLQHLESVNDLVARITGVVVRETVPDRIFDAASEVELVDLPPEDLIRRFREGKIYLPEQAERALERFFRRETLVALRELALRKTADHVNRQVELGRRGTAARPIWATRERLLVAVGPSPTSARLVRATLRMADTLRAPWYAVHFEATERRPVQPEASEQLQQNLDLAERLGAEIVAVSGPRFAEELVRFARRTGVTKVVLGKSPSVRRWWAPWRPSLVDEVLRLSGDIDVFVIRGDAEVYEPQRPMPAPEPSITRGDVRDAALVLGASLGAAVGLGLLLHAFGARTENIVLLFLVAVVVVATLTGRRASIAASVLAVACFNFFFVHPRFSFDVTDVQSLFTFAVLLAAGLLASQLVSRVRLQASTARAQAEANHLLYRVGRALSSTSGLHQVAERAQREIERWLGMESAIYLAGGAPGELRIADAVGASRLASDLRERSVASWVLRNGREAGRSTDTLPGAQATYLPLVGTAEVPLGVLGVVPASGELTRRERRLVDSLASQIALALEREQLSRAMGNAGARAEAERTRADLLETVSHDLRTPLATIEGAASVLLESWDSHTPEARRELLQDVAHEAERLGRIVENLLQLGRVGAGGLELRREWYPLEDVVATALERLRRTENIQRIAVRIPPGIPLLSIDGDLMTQLLWNLLDNALRHAPEGPIELVAAFDEGRTLTVDVLDRGPGLGPGDPEHLFERFVRGEQKVHTRGSGLGLAIARAVARVHGGELVASARDGGGACFRLSLPSEVFEPPPEMFELPPEVREPAPGAEGVA
jgi:two-component system sensor histidine kinase KdpD